MARERKQSTPKAPEIENTVLEAPIQEAPEAPIQQASQTPLTEPAAEPIAEAPLPTVEEIAARYCRVIDKMLAKLEELEEPYRGPYEHLFKQRKSIRRAGNRNAANASTCDSPVKRVWEITTSMYPSSPRKDIVKACEDAGINKWTARTQVQACLKSLASSPAPASAPSEAPEEAHTEDANA